MRKAGQFISAQETSSSMRKGHGVVWDNPVEESDRRDRDVTEEFGTFLDP